MADLPPFESPIVGTHTPGSGDLELRDESSVTKLVVRADDDTAAAAALGVAFGSSRMHDGALVVGQRPGEWTVIGQHDAAGRVVADLDRSGHVSVVDHTHARAAMRVVGDVAPSVLEKICGLDWADDMTPDGAATSASVAKVTCDIVRQDLAGVRAYLLICDRSFARYLFDAVLDAGAEFDMAVGSVTPWGSDGP